MSKDQRGLKASTPRPEHLWSLTSGSLVEVDVDALKLEVRVASISSSGVNAVLVGDNLPAIVEGTREI